MWSRSNRFTHLLPWLAVVWAWLLVGAAGLPASAQDRGDTAPSATSATDGPTGALPERLDALLKEARQFEHAGKWQDAIRRYQEVRRLAGERPETEQAIERCRRHLRIEARCRSAGTTAFAGGLTASRGLALYEELLERISASYVVQTELAPLVAEGLDNCLTAARNPVFANTYPVKHQGDARVQWQRRLLALRQGVRGAVLTPAEGGHILRRVLKANVETLALPDGAIVVEMVHGAVRGLDNYSAFLTPSRLKALRTEIDGEFVGLGIRIALRDGVLVVVEPIEGGPAAKVGVRAGDRLLAVGGRSTHGHSLEEIARLLHGPVGTPVVIEVQHVGDAEPVVLTVPRRRVILKSVTHARRLGRDKRIGYLRLSSFQKGTGAELDRALTRLEGDGLSGLILDLRGNPGGVLDSAVDVANAFLKEGVVVTTRGRAWGQNWTFRAREEGTHPDYAMVMLVDDMSASASEIVAAALKGHRRAVLVGSRTYGKGSVQSLFTLGRGDVGFRLTTARFYAPGGQSFDGVGIAPDLEIAAAPGARLGDVGEDGTGPDEQLAGAFRYLETRLLAGATPVEAPTTPE